MSLNPPSLDIAELIENANSNPIAVMDVTLFVGEAPATQDVPIQVSVHDTGGFAPDAGSDYRRPTIMVHATGSDYTASYQLAEAVRDALHTLHNETINGARYIAIWQEGEILYLGREENKIHRWSLNFRIHRTPSA